MSLIGKIVKHKLWGSGTIDSIVDRHITVSFSKPIGEKVFAYPQAFESFLSFEGEMPSEISAALAAEKAAALHNNSAFKTSTPSSSVPSHSCQSRSAKERPSIQSKKLPSFSSVEDFCQYYKRSLFSEISYLKTTGGKHQLLTDGELLESRSGYYLYSFTSDTELTYPEGTQITLWKNSVQLPGTIMGCEDFTVLLSSSNYLGNPVAALDISADAWFLLEKLSSHLEALSLSYSQIVNDLVCNGLYSIDNSSHSIVTGQDTAVKMSQTQPITFIWGPPGTGKTETLSRIALAHIAKGHRVLMLSYSNVSVDGAILRVYKNQTTNIPGQLVRYGYPRSAELLDHEYLTSYRLALYNHPELEDERDSLMQEQTHTPKKSPRYEQIQRRLREIRGILQAAEKLYISTAAFVATTVSKAVVDKAIQDAYFDVVIFDEASMAYIPQIVYAASLAQKYFICMGDFCQLPPIVMNNNAWGMDSDIFEYCGIAAAVRKGYNHKWLCMLDTQYRMHPTIAQFASNSMYHGLLHSADGMQQKRNSITSNAPMSGSTIGVADLSGMMSVCSTKQDHSHVNPMSAFVSMMMALQVPAQESVGIIAPYHAQAQLLHAMAKDAANFFPEREQIACATVHQFQGSEKDVIIYDATDCYRLAYPGPLLTSRDNNYANRLFNVAMTRAKGKFIAVANAHFMERKLPKRSLMFSEMLHLPRSKASYWAGSDLPQQIFQNGPLTCFSQKSAASAFLHDLKNAHKEIHIDIVGAVTEKLHIPGFTQLLTEATTKKVKVVVRAEKRAALPNELRAIAIENPYIKNSMTIIDKHISWLGAPFSESNFVVEGQVIPTKYYPVFRFEGIYTAKVLSAVSEMNQVIDYGVAEECSSDRKTFAGYIRATKVCPECGKPLQLKKSQKKKGHYFLSCSGYPHCNHTEWVDVDDINAYIFHENPKGGLRCPKCGVSLSAARGKYGVYVQCGGILQHRFNLEDI